MGPEFTLSFEAARFISLLARQRGRGGDEVAVMLAGPKLVKGPIPVDRVLVPRQKAFQSEGGCGLLIDGGCLNRLGPRMRESGRRIYGILHSHPGKAFHSDTDSEGVLMRFHGAFSIVIPNFGKSASLLAGAAAYKFDYESGWQEVDVSALLEVTNSSSFEVVYDD